MTGIVKTHAYLYLLREREFVRHGEDVYKLGMTQQGMGLRIHRLDSYKKGSELILTTECPVSMCANVERNLKQEFALEFTRHSDGSEYFIGNSRKMARMIFQAADSAWTEEQQLTKKEILKNAYAFTKLHLEEEHVAVKSEDQLLTECLLYLEMLFTEASKDDQTHRVPANSCRAAEQVQVEEDNNIENWVSTCVLLDSTGVIKQGDWYENYRAWANQKHVIPLIQKRAVATMKRLYPNVSIGPTTYGIKLDSAKPKTPLMSHWLRDLVMSNDTVIRVASTTLFNKYLVWCKVKKISKAAVSLINTTNFGLELKAYRGVLCKRSAAGIFYTFDFQEIHKNLSVSLSCNESRRF